MRDAYEGLQSNDKLVQLYISKYLDVATQSRDISEYAYRRGGLALLDFLDAERSYRATELGYRQTLASYLLALEQLREAVAAIDGLCLSPGAASLLGVNWRQGEEPDAKESGELIYGFAEAVTIGMLIRSLRNSKRRHLSFQVQSDHICIFGYRLDSCAVHLRGQ